MGGPTSATVDPLEARTRAGPRGWAARLALRFERRGAATCLASNRHSGPLRLIRALPQADGSCHAVLVHPPGGLVGGDTLEIDIRLDKGSRVLCTTPGAQKWYRSAGPPARSNSRIHVGEGAHLEWLPQPAMVYDGAQAEQQVAFELGRDAGMIGWECLVLGRRAMGERFLRGSLSQRLSLGVAGRPLWLEQTKAAAGDRLFASPLGWRGHCVACTVWVVGPTNESLLDAWREVLAGLEPVDPGAGKPCIVAAATRPAPGLLLARLLGDEAEQVMDAARCLWAAARPGPAGNAGPMPRIWAT